MLSAVIRSRHSYGAMHLAVQPPDQRSVHFGPLVVFCFTNADLRRLHADLRGNNTPDFSEHRLYLQLWMARFLKLEPERIFQSRVFQSPVLQSWRHVTHMSSPAPVLLRSPKVIGGSGQNSSLM